MKLKFFNYILYMCIYDIDIIDEDNSWWNYKYNKWTSLYIDGDKSSCCTFHSRRKAMKEFKRLAKLGIRCILSDSERIFNKGWYFKNEWHSEDQTYFGKKRIK